MRRLRQDVARLRQPGQGTVPSPMAAAAARDTASAAATLSDAVAGGLPSVDLTVLNTALAAELATIDGRLDALEP